MGVVMTMNENEPVAWLVTWTDKDGNEWVHAHASEGTAFDQSQQKNGILQPLYTHPAPAVADFSDAYQGAREDLAIWKKRALEAEELNRKFIADINGQTFMGEPAPAVAVNWLPLETAPKDGTMCRLLVKFEDNATDDNDGPSPTIGFNNLDNDGNDLWLFAGWNWTHDEFVQGTGEVIGWLPLLEPAVAVNEQMLEALKLAKEEMVMAGFLTISEVDDAIAAAEAAKKGGV